MKTILRRTLSRLLLAGVALLALPHAMTARAAAQELPPLVENQYIMDRLLAAAIGDEIRKNCGSISPRYFYVMQQARALEDYALRLGYTDSQIESFLDDRKARKKLMRTRDAYLSENGVEAGNEESYCRLGRAEIARQSITGTLLTEW